MLTKHHYALCSGPRYPKEGEPLLMLNGSLEMPSLTPLLPYLCPVQGQCHLPPKLSQATLCDTSLQVTQAGEGLGICQKFGSKYVTTNSLGGKSLS